MRTIAPLAVAAVAALSAAAPAVAAAPSATTAAATNVTATTAELNGVVSPNQEATTYHFDFGTTTAYGARTPDSGPLTGNAARKVSATLTGLAPSTTYHFRLVAGNASGTSTGADLTFTTAAATSTPPPAVTVRAAPRTITFGRSTTISGQVAGAGAGVKVELDATPFPFTEPFRRYENGMTAADGRYSFTVAPELNTRYHVEAKSSPPGTSADVQVNVRPRVSLRTSDRTPRAGQRVRLFGAVQPEHDGARVRLQRRTRTGGWKTIANPLLVPALPIDGVDRSRYSKRVRVRANATYRTVFRPTDGDHVRGKSRKRHLRTH
jgi:hypothetical protein